MTLKKIIFTLLAFGFLACKPSIKPQDIAYLNGYWEIKKVIIADGTQKEYTTNPSLDYIEIDANNKGFRKKVIPQIDGKFITSDVVETIEIIKKEENFFIKYTTKFATWEEKIIELNKNELTLKNQHNFEYYYQRMK